LQVCRLVRWEISPAGCYPIDILGHLMRILVESAVYVSVNSRSRSSQSTRSCPLCYHLSSLNRSCHCLPRRRCAFVVVVQQGHCLPLTKKPLTVWPSRAQHHSSGRQHIISMLPRGCNYKKQKTYEQVPIFSLIIIIIQRLQPLQASIINNTFNINT